MNFDAAIERVLGHEGGYLSPEDAAKQGDPGGETHWGISKRSYPKLDIRALTRTGAKAIYLTDFWRKVNAEKLADGVAFQALDFAVNSGPDVAVRYLQRALGVADDGHWGPVSQAAADAMSESDTLLLLIAERQDYMTRLKNWPQAGKSWIRRMSQNLRYAAEDSD